MVRRINVPSSSRLLFTVLCPMMLCAALAQAQSSQSNQQRSTGGSTFVVAPTVPLAAAPTSVAAGDLNGDGKLDLVVTTKGSGNVTVLLGDGKGGFDAGVEYAAGTRPGNALLADLTGSGKLDVIVTDSATGSVEVLRGNGDGTLGKPVAFEAIADPVGIAIGNFSGKGKTDLAVASATGLAVLVNDGTGRFTSASSVSLSHPLHALTSADLRENGKSDLIAANTDGTITVLLGDGKGSFTALAASKVASGPLSAVVSGDFNRDGRADLAVTQANSGNLTVLLGRGDGSFESGASYKVGNHPASIIVADLKGDGGADLITANAAANTFSVVAGKGDGTFETAVDFVAGNSPSAIAAGDFNSDGHADLAILNAGDKTISLPLGRGDRTFQAARSYRTGLEQKAIAAGDLNGDGLPDLVVTNFCGKDAACKSNGTATVMLANGNGTYRQGATYELGSGPVAVALADLNGDRKLDLIAVNRNDKTLMVLAGKGKGEFGEPEIYPLAASPRAVYAGDFNGDGRPDLAIATDCGRSACSEPGSVDIWLDHANGKLSISASYTVGFSPASIAAGDLRGTGHLDLAVANSCGDDSSCKSHGTASLLKGDGKGKFTDGGEIDLGSAPSSIAIASLTGKGLDLVVAERGSDQIAVLRGDGKGGFGEPAAYKAGAEPAALAIADFDRDGLPDVAVANFKDSTVSVLRGTAKGTLKPAVTYPVGAGPESMVSVASGKSGSSGLVTANGNGGTTPMGTDITLLRVHADVASTPGVAVSASPATAIVDESEVLTALVSGTAGTAPTGTVEFTSAITASIVCAEAGGTPPLDTVPFSSSSTSLGTATATCTTVSLDAGSDTITAAYTSADTTVYNDNTGTSPLTVKQADTNTTLTTTDTTPNVNESVTLTATVTVAPAPTGTAVPFSGATMQFVDNGTPIPTCNAVAVNSTTGVAHCTTTGLIGGSHSIVALYSASDPNYNGSSGAVTETVSPVASATALATSGTPSTVNESVTFTATVTPSGDAVGLSGTVTFTDNGNPADCTVSFSTSTGVATCADATLSVGPHTIVATYGSDPSYNTSSKTLTQTVHVGTTTVALTTTGSPSTINAPVTFTATVTPTPAGSVALSGSIAFTDTPSGGSATAIPNCSAVALNSSNVATCTTSSLILGSHSIKATYANDTNFSGNSDTVAQVVDTGATTLALTSSLNPSTVNVSPAVSFTATVTAPSGSTALTGTVAFTDNTVAIPGCSAVTPSSSGVATCFDPGLTASATAHTIKAVYANDLNFVGSNKTLAQTVNKAATSIAVITSASPSTFNVPVTFTATLTFPSGSVALSGTVAFTDSVTSAAIPGCATVAPSSSGVAICTTSGLALGAHTITAAFANDTNFASISNTVSQSVSTAATSVVVTSSLNPATVNVSPAVSFTATVTASSGAMSLTGTVAFTDNTVTIPGCAAIAPSNSGVAVCSDPGLVALASAHAIKATYAHDPNVATGSGTFSETVNQASTTLLLTQTSTNTSVNASVTFTATLTAPSGSVGITGTVTFTDSVTAAAIPNCAALSPNSAGVTTCTYTGLSKGSHTITASFGPDSNFATSSNSVIHTVGTAAASITIVSSTSNTSTVNQTVKFTATIAPVPFGSASLTGTVAFTDNLAQIAGCTAVSPSAAGVAACTDTALTAAGSPHSIAAAYGGDPNFIVTAGAGNPLTQTVSTATTSLALIQSSASSPVDQSVTFTATLTAPKGGVAVTGTVAFVDSVTAVAIPTCTAVPPSSTGVAVCTTSGLTLGSHTITATFASDPNFATSFNTVIHNITAVTTNITLTSSSIGNASTVNQTVQFTATIPIPSGTTTLTGKVGFTDAPQGGAPTPIAGCTAIAPTTSGVAVCSDNALTASGSTHTITATYSGDKNFTVAPGQLAQTVSQATTSLNLGSSPNPSTTNQAVTFTATLTAPSGGVGIKGTVAFTDTPEGGTTTPISGCTAVPLKVISGTNEATCTTATLVLGPHTIAATFANDPNFSTSNGNVAQTVNAALTTIALTSSASPLTVNQNVIFTAAFSVPAGTAKPSGTVTFNDTFNGATVTLCNAVTLTLQGGTTTPWAATATCADQKLFAGSHSVTASYAGDSNFSVSAGNFAQQVTQAASSTALTTGPNPSFSSVNNPKNFEDSVVLTATVTPSTGPVFLSGSVTFTSNGQPIPECLSAIPVNTTTGVATCTTTSLTPGTDSIDAAYNGDSNFSSSTFARAQSVEDYSIALSVPSVTVSQGSTTSSDLFTPQPINVAPVSTNGYSTATGKPLNLVCTVTNASGATVKAPACELAGGTSSTATLAVAKTGVQQQSVAIVINATSNAAPGQYTVNVTATDPTTGLVRSATSDGGALVGFELTVRALSAPLSIVSGATSGNTGNVTFVLPKGVTLSGISCPSIGGTGISSTTETPGEIGVACHISPSSLGSAGSTSTQTVTAAVTVTTNNPLHSAGLVKHSNLLFAGLFGIPFFGLFGLLSRKPARKTFFRLLAFLAIGVALLQPMGCGGSFHTSTTSVNGGTTPPGTYYILVQGSGSDGNTYDAVLEVIVSVL